MKKFERFLDKSSPYYNPIVKNVFFKAWHYWLNPLGNYHEPLPFPENRADEAKEHWLGKRMPGLYWGLRNPAHNLTHFMLGITPKGNRYEWLSPTENGWYDNGEKWMKKYRLALPKLGDDRKWGWMRSGNFRVKSRG